MACLLPTGVENEDHFAAIVVVHVPTSEVIVDNLYGGSYAIDVRKAHSQHREMQRAVKSFGAAIYEVRDVLLNGTQDKNGSAYVDLVNLASKSLVYDIEPAKKDYRRLSNMKGLNNERRKSLRKGLLEVKPQLQPQYQENYRWQTLWTLTTEELIHLCLNPATVVVNLRNRFVENRSITTLVTKQVLDPLRAIYFMRDHQITTKKGIVILNSSHRPNERSVTEFVLKKLGLKVIGKLNDSYAEGGDFLPYGEIAFFGVGQRTDYEAVAELMTRDLFGYPEIAIIRDVNDFKYDRMHLDTFFNILDGNKNVLVAEDVLNNASMRRYVDVYSNKVKNGGRSGTKYGNYVNVERNTEFGEFLRQRGFKITTVSISEQLDFAVNFLNIGNGTIVTPYCETSYVNKLKNVGINVTCVNIDQLTKGGGAVHCMTQVVYRTRNL